MSRAACARAAAAVCAIGLLAIGGPRAFAEGPRPALQPGPGLPEHPPAPVLAEGEVLSPNGAEWRVWADPYVGPPAFPLDALPVEDMTVEDVLGAAAQSPDRLIPLYDGAATDPPGPGWISGAMAPFDGYSIGGYAYEAPQRERAERRRARYGHDDPSRTRFVYEVAGEMLPPDPETGEVLPNPEHEASDALPEEGLRNLYFVREFEVADPSEYVALQMELEFTAGAVVYLNGEELARHHVPPGGEAFGEPARPYWLPDHVNQTMYRRWQMTWLGIEPERLRPGTNVLAVAVYKRPSGGRRTLFFDLRLEGHREAAFLKTPYLQRVEPERITVMWETTTAGYGYVEVGESADALDRAFTTAQVAGGHHEIAVTGLQADTRYYYRAVTVDLQGRQIASDVRTFRTATHDPAEAFSFIAYGDNRSHPEVHHPLVDQMWIDALARDAGFILSTGDLVTNASPWQEWQEEFFEPALPLMGHFAYYTSLGNHEGNHESYYMNLDLPGNEAWYSFRYGDAEFFALNTSADYEPGSPQHTWLVEALTASTATWRVAFFHHPPYACTPSRKPGDLGVQEHLVPLFEAHGVQLVLAGHDHLYGRSREMNGVVYVITGGGGAPQYPSESDEINEICLTEYHYCIVDVFPDRLDVQSIALGGAELDRFTLTP